MTPRLLPSTRPSRKSPRSSAANRDCRHEEEPGCAVRDHVDPARLASYRKLRREQAYAERKDYPAAARAEKERWKKIHKAMRKPG